MPEQKVVTAKPLADVARKLGARLKRHANGAGDDADAKQGLKDFIARKRAALRK
jgi:hypothetical protein